MERDPKPNALPAAGSRGSDAVASYFTELGAYERHFNEMQSRYRTLTSTWLLAAIAAIGFVLTKQLNVSIDKSLLIAAIGFAGAGGVALLWNLDLMVYHRLLESVFLAGLQLECDNPDVPQIRTRMDETMEHHGVTPRVVSYYLVTTGALLLVAVIAFASWATGPLGAWAAVPTAALLCCAAVCLWLMHRATRKQAIGVARTATNFGEQHLL